MENSIKTENLPAEISKLIQIEKEHGHIGFLYGLETEEEVSEKYQYILRLFDDLENDNEKEKDAFLEIESLILAGLLTSETAATILIDTLPGYVKCAACVEQILRNNSIVDCNVFCGIYYKGLYTRISDTLAKKQKEDSYLNSLYDAMRYVNDKYVTRYGTDNTSKWFQGRGAVYTVITGGYDELKEPETVNSEWDYYCFTDCPEKYSSSVWKIVRIDNPENLNSVLLQRKLKMKPYQYLSDYDFTIYIDGKILITGDIQKYINSFSGENSMLCFAHPSRSLLSEEADAIIYFKRYSNTELLKKQVEHYYSEGYKDNMQMVDSCVLVRSNKDPILIQVMEDWWKEVNTWTIRDQISFGYCCWKNNYVIDISNLIISSNPFFTTKNHS